MGSDTPRRSVGPEDDEERAGRYPDARDAGTEAEDRRIERAIHKRPGKGKTPGPANAARPKGG